MSCPTCDHTMHGIDTVPEAGPLYWCPRCGTLHRPMKGNHPPDTSAPALVERCRKFEALAFCPANPDYREGFAAETLWVRLGVPESINVPADRPN